MGLTAFPLSVRLSIYTSACGFVCLTALDGHRVGAGSLDTSVHQVLLSVLHGFSLEEAHLDTDTSRERCYTTTYCNSYSVPT